MYKFFRRQFRSSVAGATMRRRNLLEIIKQRTDQGRRSGELKTLYSDCRSIEYNGHSYSVMIKKNIIYDRPVNLLASPVSGSFVDPFMPPYPADLHVPEWESKVAPKKYALLLNKFNVMNWHVLLVTTEFASQFTALADDDLMATYEVVSELNCFGFFNGGREAGPSQPHRHLQIVPLEDNNFPFYEVITAACAEHEAAEVFVIDKFEFHHAVVRIPMNATGEMLQRIYRRALAAVQIILPEVASVDIPPHNLLLSPSWLMVVPRRIAEIDSISGNGLNFIGSFFVKNDALYERLCHLSPMKVLVELGYEKPLKNKL